MLFEYTILYVADVARTVAFYEEALGLKRRFVHEEGDYAEMETGSTRLAFAQHRLAASNFVDLPQGYTKSNLNAPAAGFELGFIVDNLESAYTKALAHGACAVSPPTTKPWGQTVAYVRDIDGVLIAFGTSIS